MNPTLLADPRWTAAAQALVEGCIDLPNEDDRVALLLAVCEGLGDELYPAFLRVLSLIGRLGDHAARAAVALALVHALRTGRLPVGRRVAWGGTSASSDASSFGRTRSLGPLEYLCAWHAQDESDSALTAGQFEAAARALMDLISASREARLLYCGKLIADAEDPLGGALSRNVREALRALATAWAQGASPAEAATRFLAALETHRSRSLAGLMPPAVFG
jgi:hypothetical protein